ncbi:MAG: hypothetical protein ACRESS_09525 [Stenotrophobium sp.]
MDPGSEVKAECEAMIAERSVRNGNMHLILAPPASSHSHIHN